MNVLICLEYPHFFSVTSSLCQNGKPVANALKQTSFDRGVARELVLVLTASDNMATYSCDAKNEAKKTISANTKLMVYCEGDQSLECYRNSFNFIPLRQERTEWDQLI